MNWREFPFVKLFFSFALGIFVAIYCEHPIPNTIQLIGILLLLLFVSTMLSISYKNRWIHGIILYLFLFCSGHHLYFLQKDDLQPNHFRHHLEQSNTISAMVQSPPSGQGKHLNCRLKVKEIILKSGELKQVKGNLNALLERDIITEQLQYGDIVRIKTKIKPTNSPLNPTDFDFAWHLKSQNCFYQTYIKAGQVELLARNQGHSILQIANYSRKKLTHLLLNHITGPHEAAVAIALSLGDRNYIDSELKSAYAGTGATHVLAVSGLHVGLVYLGLSWLLLKSRLKDRRWWIFRVTILLLGVWSYALLTGATPSVLRAATMFSFLIAGDNLHRHASIFNTLAVSAFCLLWINPFLLIQPGFQLSYAAVIGIVYFQPKIYRLWYIENQFGDIIWKLITISLAAQLVTLPFTLYYFHQFPVFFWLSGLVVVPAAMIILPLCFIFFITSFLIPILAAFFAKCLFIIVWLTNAVIFFIDQLPGSLIQNIWISIFSFLSCYLILSSLALLINTRKIKWWYTTLSGVLLLSISISLDKIQHQSQETFTLYHHYEHTLIDLFYGKKALAIKSQDLEKNLENRLADQHRSKNGIKSISYSNLVESNATFSFQDKVWHILTPPNLPSKKTNILIINNLDLNDLSPYLQSDDLELVVFGAANKSWTTAKGIKLCEQFNIAHHNIQSTGAFIYPSQSNKK